MWQLKNLHGTLNPSQPTDPMTAGLKTANNHYLHHTQIRLPLQGDLKQAAFIWQKQLKYDFREGHRGAANVLVVAVGWLTVEDCVVASAPVTFQLVFNWNVGQTHNNWFETEFVVLSWVSIFVFVFVLNSLCCFVVVNIVLKTCTRLIKAEVCW